MVQSVFKKAKSKSPINYKVTGSLMRGILLHKKVTSNPWEGVGMSNKSSKGNKGTSRESVSEEQREKYSSLETSVICRKVQLTAINGHPKDV
ncbi:unnamed protein product [Rhizophagus irregularis]|nr:unnamed protein product [Rhizophagus irregularis]